VDRTRSTSSIAAISPRRCGNLEDDLVNVAWQEHIGRFVDHFELVGSAPEGMPLRTVWRLRDQTRWSPAPCSPRDEVSTLRVRP
jgi:hypothetical protein